MSQSFHRQRLILKGTIPRNEKRQPDYIWRCATDRLSGTKRTADPGLSKDSRNIPVATRQRAQTYVLNTHDFHFYLFFPPLHRFVWSAMLAGTRLEYERLNDN